MKTIVRLLSLCMACSFLSVGAYAVQDTLTILHVNDTHSNLAPIGPRSTSLEGSLGGIARAASLIGFQKETSPNPILLHAGDAFVGDLFYNVYFGVPELQIMTALGFDAMAVGNHEFDLTPAALYGALDAAFENGGFPLLSANLILDDPGVEPLKQFISPYIVKQVDTINVGIFGLTTPSTNLISQPAPAVVDENIVEIATAMVDSLTARGADVIICLSHLGVTLDSVIALYVPGIHGIVGGHDHYLFEEPRYVQNVLGDSVWIVQASSYYLNLGKLTLSVENSTVRVIAYEMIPIADPIPQEPSIAATVDQLIAGIEAAYGQPFYTQQVGVVEEFLEEFDRTPLEYGDRSMPLGNLVADAFRAATGAEIGIEANGSIAQPLYAGPIVPADIYRAVGYGFNEDNYLGYRLATLEINGAALLAGLEFGFSTLETNDDFLLQVSGMSYVYDPGMPAGQRLVCATVGDNPLNPEATYTVATNEFVPLILDAIGIPYSNLHIFRDTTEFQILLGYVSSLDTVRSVTDRRVWAAPTCVITSVPMATSTMPSEYGLAQNYPNPFNPSTTIRFALPTSGHVTLTIHNLLGQEIGTLVDGELDAGRHSVVFDAAGLPSGVYFYRLQSGRLVSTKKLMLVK
jgi:5'-nucleotidase/UDP-sugar diphosphatase